MGVWNSHTSVGNILGSLIAGAFVSTTWGLSFIVPGLIITSTGVLCFFFLVESQFDQSFFSLCRKTQPIGKSQTRYIEACCMPYFEKIGDF